MANSNNGFKKFLCSGAGKAVMIIIGYVVILAGLSIAFGIISSNPGENMVTFILITEFIFAIFGWIALKKITPRIFLILPLIGWIIYFLIKLLLAMLIGGFVAPFVISKAIANIVQKSLKKQMERENTSENSPNAKTESANSTDSVVKQEVPSEPIVETPASAKPLSAEEQQNNIQLLKEYKTLLDSGIITQEEFNEKKARLLNYPSNQSLNSASTSLENTPSSNEISISDNDSNTTLQTKKKKKKSVVVSVLVYTFLVLWICFIVLLIPNVRFWLAKTLVDTPINQVSYILFDTLSNYEESEVYQDKIRYLDALSLAHEGNLDEARALLNDNLYGSYSIQVVKDDEIDGQSIIDYAKTVHHKNNHTFKDISYVYDDTHNPIMSSSFSVYIEYVYDADGICTKIIAVIRTR